jgi:hypothetical protein
MTVASNFEVFTKSSLKVSSNFKNRETVNHYGGTIQFSVVFRAAQRHENPHAGAQGASLTWMPKKSR